MQTASQLNDQIVLVCLVDTKKMKSLYNRWSENTFIAKIWIMKIELAMYIYFVIISHD